MIIVTEAKRDGETLMAVGLYRHCIWFQIWGETEEKARRTKSVFALGTYMTINWAKTKLQDLGDMDGANQTQHATVLGNQVEVVESFTYLGCLIHCSGSSEPEIKRRANIVREAMFSLDQNIWRSSITLETKLRLYNTCILPIFFIWC